MVEAHFAEIEKALLYISEARQRAEKAAAALRRDDATRERILRYLRRYGGRLQRTR